MVIRIDEASLEQVRTHLANCDLQFIEDLASRVDLGEYLDKLAERALRVEAWEGNELVGLVAVYVNDHVSRVAFVTHVSVVSARQGSGVARRLLAAAMDAARVRGMIRLDLEVQSGNDRARRLYTAAGLTTVRADGTTVVMSMDLERENHS